MDRHSLLAVSDVPFPKIRMSALVELLPSAENKLILDGEPMRVEEISRSPVALEDNLYLYEPVDTGMERENSEAVTPPLDIMEVLVVDVETMLRAKKLFATDAPPRTVREAPEALVDEVASEGSLRLTKPYISTVFVAFKRICVTSLVPRDRLRAVPVPVAEVKTPYTPSL